MKLPVTRDALVNVLFKALPAPFEKLSRVVLVLVAAPALGPATFGTYQFATTTALLLVALTELGLGTATTRALARHPESGARVFAQGLRVRAVSALPYLVLLSAVALTQPAGDARSATMLLGLAALAGSGVDYLGAVLRGYEDFRREAAMNVARAVLTTATALGALRLARSLTAFGGGLAAGALLSFFLGLALARGRVSRAPSAVEGEGASSGGLAELVPLWLAGVLSILYFRCDVVLLHALTRDAEVGFYGAAYRLFEALMLVPSAIMAVAFPRLSRARAGDQSPGWSPLESRLVALLGLLGLVAGAGLFLAADPIVSLAFGPDFASAAPSLRALALAVPFLFLNFALTAFLFARGQERRYLVIVTGSLVLNVAANLVAIPRWGGAGAGFVTALTEAALAAGALVASRRG